MKASELRIGNLVQYGGCTAKVCQIEKSFFYCETDGNDLFTRDGEPGAKPIPLTEEWLLKFGFQQVRPYYFVHNGFEAGLDGDDFVNDMWTIMISKALPVKIKYVHQLQNLYWCLCYEELVLNNN